MNSIPDKIRERKYILSAVKAAVILVMLYTIFDSLRMDRFASRYSNTELAVKGLFVVVISGFLSYGIWMIEKLLETYKNTEKRQGFLYALYFSVYIARLFNPVDALRTQVTSLNRAIGHGIIYGVDVSKRVSNFNFWFLYLAFTFVLFYLLANYWRSKVYSGESRKMLEFLDNLMVLANLLQGIRCIGFFSDRFLENPAFYYSDYLVMVLILIGITYIGLGLEKRITVDQLAKLIVSGWMLSYPAAIIVASSAVFGLREWNSGRLLMGLQVFSSLMFLAAARFVKVNWEGRRVSSALTVTVVSLSFLPFFTSFFIELVTILNQHEIFLVSPRNVYVLTVFTGLLLTALVVMVVGKKDMCLRRWKHIAYPAVIFGIICLWKQAEVWKEYSPHILESANAGVLISDFLNFGDIPIVQHYGGHMMTGVWEGILYGLLNNDFLGAAFSPYSEYVATVIGVLFFLLVKRVWDEDMALLVALFFPFYDYVTVWGLGILMCLAASAYMKKQTYGRGILFWLSFGWCTLYRLDLGFAFGAACGSVMVLYSVAERKGRTLRQLVVSMATVAGGGGIAWFAVCVVNKVNPWDRLLEFLFISASNQNWGFNVIGDPRSFLYFWAYLLVPFGVVLCLIFAVFSKSLREDGSRERRLLILILGCAYLYNYPRGIVRHSLVESSEMGMLLMIWTSSVFFAMFTSGIRKNGKLFLPVFTVCILCNAQLFSGSASLRISAADYCAGRIGGFIEDWRWEKSKEEQNVIQRVRFDKDFRNVIKGYELMLDTLLEEDETFVDFINKTTVYPAVGRRDPAYISQSPMQLSGEFSQEKFIEEIKGIPVILMPIDAGNYQASAGLDQIANSVRYYKAAEYIYQNYVPLCAYLDTFAVWCLPERYEEMAGKVRAVLDSGVELNDGLVESRDILPDHAELACDENGWVTINSVGSDPNVGELQELFGDTPYIDDQVKLTVHYKTDVSGPLELFYTESEGEDYTGDKRLSEIISGEGTACFEFPFTRWTHMRLDIPEGSEVTIKALKIDSHGWRFIDYGYDGPCQAEDGETYTYLPCIHDYSLYSLPRIWAETDRKRSCDNPMVLDVEERDGIYRFDLPEGEPAKEGNYLKVEMDHEGGGTSATLKLGNYEDGRFQLKYRYTFSVEPGFHQYMFRVSSDYYWYQKQVNAAVLQWENGEIQQVDMKILQGD